MGLKPSVFCPKTPAKTRETNAYFSKTPPTLTHMPPDGRYHLKYNLDFREVARGIKSLCQRLFHACVPIAPMIYRTGRKFRGVFNFAFFVGGCRTRKLKPAKGFVYACEIVTHPNSTKFTTREIFQIRQNIELHENLHPRNFLPVR